MDVPAEAIGLGWGFDHRLPARETELADRAPLDCVLRWPTAGQDVWQEAGHCIHKDHPLGRVRLRAERRKQLRMSRAGAGWDEQSHLMFSHSWILRKGVMV